MSNLLIFQDIANEMPLFQDLEQKERFIFVVGALVSRLISLHKAAEIMNMGVDTFLEVLDLMGFDFSYLQTEDIGIEKSW